MTKLVQSFLTIVQNLSPKERRQFCRGLIDAGVLTEDEQDHIVLRKRRTEPTRPLADFVSEMKRKGRLQ